MILICFIFGDSARRLRLISSKACGVDSREAGRMFSRARIK